MSAGIIFCLKVLDFVAFQCYVIDKQILHSVTVELNKARPWLEITERDTQNEKIKFLKCFSTSYKTAGSGKNYQKRQPNSLRIKYIADWLLC